ncbi:MULTISPECIES: CAP domain-containing protein [Streptomyces]|uniref:SCP domain-containing protein n=1 Tax=Streptomyces dengpaensis TaxID=2049881 RepID=A0ABN5ICL7_9ACTN|nr:MULTISPECIES: CAP domain-containing protein [Streptomyces]AVH60932.1 hypothetical protein C4B68_02905 [Streptomyces dengpaensis]PIB08435.1 hypothetical protein B1C81_14890 [Streptomyces sp. HG99]
MSELVPGGNLPLPGGTLTLGVPGPFDVFALITDDSGKVRGDGDFVFYNQPSAPGARLAGEHLTIDPMGLRPGASRVTVVVSPADPEPAARAHPAHHRAEQSRRTLCDPVFSQGGLAYVADRRSGDMYWTALWARPFSPADLRRTASEVIALTNAERTACGLPPLSPDSPLTTAAQAHSADMVARAFYSHTSPDGSRPWDRAAAAGCTRRTIGENIACGQRSPAEVVRGWMNSPGHRANILKPDFTHIGIGLAGGGKAGTYWTQLFGG